MKIVVIRHAIAKDRELFNKKNSNDDLRPLTIVGRREFTKNSKAIKAIVPKVDKIFSSPLLRALQTAEILEKCYKKKKLVIEELRPKSDFIELLKKISKYKISMIVGHEPFLSEFIGYMVGSKRTPIILKKGGMCVIDCDSMAYGQGKIQTHLAPKILSLI